MIASLIAVYELCPKLDISKDPDTLDASDAMATQFSVRNNSHLRLSDVHSMCYVSNLKVNARGGFGHFSIATPPGSVAEILPANETMTVPSLFNAVVDLKGHKVVSADVQIIVDFRYPLWWKTIRSSARFVTKRTRDGSLKWFAQPHEGE